MFIQITKGTKYKEIFRGELLGIHQGFVQGTYANEYLIMPVAVIKNKDRIEVVGLQNKREPITIKEIDEASALAFDLYEYGENC